MIKSLLDTHSKDEKTGSNVGQNVLMNSPHAAAELAHSFALFSTLRDRYSQAELAERLSVSMKTVGRWERGETVFPAYLEHALKALSLEPGLVPRYPTFNSERSICSLASAEYGPDLLNTGVAVSSRVSGTRSQRRPISKTSPKPTSLLEK